MKIVRSFKGYLQNCFFNIFLFRNCKICITTNLFKQHKHNNIAPAVLQDLMTHH